MGIDVMITSAAEAIASRPGEAMMQWLNGRFSDYDIRYGYVELDEDDVHELAARFERDDVGAMLVEKVQRMRANGESPPYVIELMIGW